MANEAIQQESEQIQQATDPKVVILKDNENIPGEFTDEVAIVRIWTSTANPDIRGDFIGHVSLELILDDKRGSWDKRTYISVGPKCNEDDYSILVTKPFHQYHVKYAQNYADDIECEGRPPECTFVFYTLDIVAMKLAVDQFLETYPLDNQRWTTAGPSFSLGDAKMSYWEIISDMFQWYTTQNSSDRKCLQNAAQNSTHNEDTMKNVSCVSLAFEILNKGCLSTKLLTNEAAKKTFLALSDQSSEQSVQGVRHLEYLRILKAAGYVLEYGLSSFILSPDVFVDLMKAAKRKELRDKGPPNVVLEFDNNIVTLYKVTEEIPSLKQKKKRPYHFMVFSAVAIILIAVLTFRWTSA